jgi:hypothetical protein
MIVQLFVFAVFFLGFGIFSLIRKRKFLGFTFALLGIMLLIVGGVAVYLYPHIWPF